MRRVICTICLVAILLIVGGCAESTDKKIVTEPRPEPAKRLYNY